MGKKIIYLGIAIAVGICIGYFIFGIPSSFEIGHEHDVQSSDMMWTCSMHPQIKQHQPGDCPICGMDLTQVNSGSQEVSADEIRMTKNAMALANIETTIVDNEAAHIGNIKLSGKIKSNENNIAVQVTHFSGRIERLFTKTSGELVKKGQVLAIIYSPELVAAQQELLTTLTLKKSQPELYKAIRNKLKLRKLSDDQIDNIESSGKIQEKFPIRSEVSGVISENMIGEGDHIKRGQVLFKVVNLSSVWASFDAYENQLASLQVGQHIKIKTNAYPDKEFDAKIDFINPIFNTAKRTVEIRTVLGNRESLLKPGMFVEGAIVAPKDGAKTNVVSIPKSAVLWTGKRSLVYLKKDRTIPVFEAQEVILGNEIGDYYEIVKGLQLGDEVVIKGAFTVDAAAQLQGKKSMMNTVNEDPFSESFQKKFEDIVNLYIRLKDGLVASNPSVAASKADQMLSLLDQVIADHIELGENQNIANLQKALNQMIKEESIQQQRDYFIRLSENLIAIIDGFQLLNKTYYVQKCPMANSNKGAVWLSNEEQIRNPYFGESMLTCGSVIDVLKIE